MMGSMSPQVIGTLAALLFPSVVNSTLPATEGLWMVCLGGKSSLYYPGLTRRHAAQFTPG
jgi:hypothetical protein